MVAMVLRDYRLRFFECLRKALTLTNIYMFFYLMFTSLLWHLATEQLIAYYITIVPEFLLLFLSRMYGEGLSKPMFLCPLSAKDRFEYVKCGYWIRVGIGIGMGGIATILLLVLHVTAPYIAGLFFLVMLCYSLAINVYCPPTGKDEQLGTEQYPQRGYLFFDTLMRILCILTPIFLTVIGADASTIEIVLTGSFVLITIWAAIEMFRRYYLAMLFFSAEYEKTDAGYAMAMKEKEKEKRGRRK